MDSNSNSQNEMPGSSKDIGPKKDKLFDPSIDMLVNDFDDERTLEEEEAMAAGEANDPSMELSNLEREGNMPLEELLALYGYNTKEEESSSECDEVEEEETETQEPELICQPIIEKEKSPSPSKQSKLTLLYEPMAEDIDDSKNISSVSKLSEDEDEEGDSNMEDEEYQKFEGGVHSIMVGSDYQAQVPEGLCDYEEIPANDTEDKLLWSPCESLNPKKLEDYLKRALEIYKPIIPNGNALRDDEDALYLLQECAYNEDEALKRLKMKGPVISNKGHDVKWTEDECRNFEAGMRNFGKDFLQIQQNKVRTKTVGELVQFYYLWKKTERHDAFANKSRLEKKKYAFHPGFTDFMDRFLDDPEKDSKAVPGTANGGTKSDV